MSTNILIVADFLDIQPYIEVSISDDANLKLLDLPRIKKLLLIYVINITLT